jgi:hypothetical protein
MALATITAGIAIAAAFGETPKPSVVPVSWQLEFEHKQLQPIRLTLPGESSPRTFWYLIYTVTNRTGEDRFFVPDCTLYTDTGQLLRAGRNVPPNVFEEIKKLHNDPLLQDGSAMTGKLLQGEDNARTGVAIWSDFEQDASSLDLFFGGLSGETMSVKLPAPVQVMEYTAAGKKVQRETSELVLTKTLELSYRLTVEPAKRHEKAPTLLSKDWVMR